MNTDQNDSSMLEAIIGLKFNSYHKSVQEVTLANAPQDLKSICPGCDNKECESGLTMAMTYAIAKDFADTINTIGKAQNVRISGAFFDPDKIIALIPVLIEHNAQMYEEFKERVLQVFGISHEDFKAYINIVLSFNPAMFICKQQGLSLKDIQAKFKGPVEFFDSLTPDVRDLLGELSKVDTEFRIDLMKPLFEETFKVIEVPKNAVVGQGSNSIN